MHHIIEIHCLDFMKKKINLELVFHGEQGGEMLHSTTAKIERGISGGRKESKRIFSSALKTTTYKVIASAKKEGGGDDYIILPDSTLQVCE